MISDVYFPRVNGVSTSIMTFRRELEARGHRVTLIVPDYGESSAAEPGVHRIPARTLFFDREDRMMRSRHISRLLPRLRSEGVDLVHIQTPFVAHYAGLYLSRQLEVPRLATYHTFFEEYLDHYIRFLPRRWLRLIARRFSRRQCNDMHRLVLPSRAMLQVLRRYGVGTDAAVIPTGIELEAFSTGDGERFRRTHNIPPERPLLIYVGRVAHEKNITFLLRVVAHLRQSVPDVLLVIAGEGPARSALEQTARQLGITENLLFVGYLSRTRELQECYRAGDLFVFASRTETQGLVLLEAMALGVPVVSTAVMGTRDVLQEGAGALVAPESEPEFAARVREVLDDPALRQRLSSSARRYAARWSAGRLAEDLITLYGELLEEWHENGQQQAPERVVVPVITPSHGCDRVGQK